MQKYKSVNHVVAPVLKYRLTAVLILAAVSATAFAPVSAATPPPTAVQPASTSTPPTAAPLAQTSSQQRESMKIRLRVGNRIISATLNDSRTTRDFLALLPLTLTLEDYAATEKIAYLPRRLSTEGAPEGSDPSPGDIAYYASWGNLAIYCRDFGYSRGLIILGKIEGDSEALCTPGALRVTIEQVE